MDHARAPRQRSSPACAATQAPLGSALCRLPAACIPSIAHFKTFVHVRKRTSCQLPHFLVAVPQRSSTCCAATSLPDSAAERPSTPESRPQAEATVVALDVEFIHLKPPSGPAISLPAYVCVVDRDLNVLYKTRILPRAIGKAKWAGGVRLHEVAGAPPLAEVTAALQSLLAGRRVVGHGVRKDLNFLGIDHPNSLVYDTMSLPLFQNQAGNALSLKRLAATFLDIAIQPAGCLHDPEEDAKAVMQLFVRYAEPKLLETFDDLVGYYERQLMTASIRAAPRRHQDGHNQPLPE